MGNPSQRLPLSLWIIDSVNANSPQPNRQERHLNPWCSSLNFCAIKSGREPEREALIHSSNVTFLKFLSTAETSLLHMPTFLFIKWSLGQPHLCILRVSPQLESRTGQLLPFTRSLFMGFFNKRVLALSTNVRIALEAGLQSRDCFCLLAGYLPFEWG